MKLGETSQLRAYQMAVESASKEGDWESVVFLGKLICGVAKGKRTDRISRLADIMVKGYSAERDEEEIKVLKKGIDLYNSWISGYSQGGVRYEEALSQVKANAWKHGESPVD